MPSWGVEMMIYIGIILTIFTVTTIHILTEPKLQLPSMVEFDGTPVNKRVIVAQPVIDPFLQEAEMEVELMLKREE